MDGVKVIINKLQKTLGNFQLNIEYMKISEPGIYGIIGPNGSGKSTLAKLIAGILNPDSGSIDYEGLKPRDITMITQIPYIMDDTIFNNLVYPLKLRKTEANQAVTEKMLSVCGFKGREKENAKSLSGGEKQKLALCRAMIFQPKMLIADESFADLDYDSINVFEDMVLEMQKKEPLIWILISHQIPRLQRLCDFAFFLNNGELKAGGTIEEILNSDNPVIRKFTKYESGIQV